MSDEVNEDGNIRGGIASFRAQWRKFGSLGGKLLHAVFAEEMQTEARGFRDGGSWISLRHGHQLYIAAGATGCAASTCDRIFEAFEILSQYRHLVLAPAVAAAATQPSLSTS